jgi:hypothetical protein
MTPGSMRPASVPVVGQDPDALAATGAALADVVRVEPILLGADGVLPTSLRGRRVALYVLAAAVPADPVDVTACTRLRALIPAVLPVAAGFADCAHAPAVAAESARRLGLPRVLPADPETVRRALDALPPPAAHPPAAPSARSASESRHWDGRAERAAYLRSALARARVQLLADSAARHRRAAGREQPAERVTGELRVVAERCRADTEEVIAAIRRGTLAGWPDGGERTPSGSWNCAPPPVAEPDRFRPEDLLLPLVMASAALGVARVLPIGPMAVPVSVLLALLGALWLLRLRRRTADRARRRAWAGEAAGAARQRVDQQIVAALVTAEAQIGLVLSTPPRGSGTDRRSGASE